MGPLPSLCRSQPTISSLVDPWWLLSYTAHITVDLGPLNLLLLISTSGGHSFYICTHFTRLSIQIDSKCWCNPSYVDRLVSGQLVFLHGKTGLKNLNRSPGQWSYQLIVVLPRRHLEFERLQEANLKRVRTSSPEMGVLPLGLTGCLGRQ